MVCRQAIEIEKDILAETFSPDPLYASTCIECWKSRSVLCGDSSKVQKWEPRRIAFNIAGVLLVVAGCVWFLQGINVLPGSFMTGQIRWAVYGGYCCDRRCG